MIEPKFEIVKPYEFKIQYGYQVLSPEMSAVMGVDMAAGGQEPIPDPPTKKTMYLMPDSFKEYLSEAMSTRFNRFLSNKILEQVNKEWKLTQLLERNL